MKKITLYISLFFTLLHVFVIWMLNFNTPVFINKSSEFITYQIEKSFKHEFKKMKLPGVFASAKSFLENRAHITEKFEELVKNEIPVIIDEMNKMGNDAFPSVDETFNTFRSFTDPSYLKKWLKHRFYSTLQSLKRSLNIFLCTNLAVFLFIIILQQKQQGSTTLTVLSLICIIAVLISSVIYLFNQNWFFAIISNSYIDMGYSVIFIIIFLILADLGLNNGKISKKLGYFG